MTDGVRSLNDFWPEGLSSLAMYLFPDPGTFDREVLIRELAARKLPHGEDGTRLTLIVIGKGGSEGFASRLQVTKDEKGVDQIEIDMRKLTITSGEALDIVQIPLLISAAYSGDPKEPTVSFLSFVLQPGVWRPAFPLPMTIPAFADGVGATPEIQGFDFAYPGVASPLRRATIALGHGKNPPLHVKPMISVPFQPADSVLERICTAGAEVLPAFATRVAPL